MDLLLLGPQRHAVPLGHPQPVLPQYTQNEKLRRNARVSRGDGCRAVLAEGADLLAPCEDGKFLGII